MGLWFTEDTYEKNREYNEIFSNRSYVTYSNWREERRNTLDRINKPYTNKAIHNNNDQTETIRYLKRLIERFQFRINISLSAEGVSTHFIRMVVSTFRDELQDTISEIDKKISNLPLCRSLEIELMSATDEIEEKRIFILQVINHVVSVAISNAEYVSEAEMKSISKDIWSLIQWYYDDARLFGILPDSEISPRKFTEFFVKEFNAGTCKCSRCSRETTKVTNKCLFCGNLLRSKDGTENVTYS